MLSDKRTSSFSSAGPSPPKGGALALVSTRTLGFFCKTIGLVAGRCLELTRFLAGKPERNGLGWYNPIQGRFR